MLKVEVINPAGKRLRGNPEHLGRLLVKINGCSTPQQTQNALFDQDLVNRGRVVRRNGWTVKLVKVN